MAKIKTLYIIITVLSSCLIITSVLSLYENSRPIKAQIDEAIKKFDVGFVKTVATQFYNNNLYVFYETSKGTVKIVLVKSNALETMKVEAVIGETPMYSERDVTWHGIGNAAPGDTELLYGIIFDPLVSQLILESEDDQMAHIFKIDEEKSVWYKFLDNDLSTPIIITGTDKKGKEMFYYGPYRGEK